VVQRWFFVHTVAIPVALLAVGVLGIRLTRSTRLAPLED
jgi:hypothetical protein